MASLRDELKRLSDRLDTMEARIIAAIGEEGEQPTTTNEPKKPPAIELRPFNNEMGSASSTTQMPIRNPAFTMPPTPPTPDAPSGPATPV